MYILFIFNGFEIDLQWKGRIPSWREVFSSSFLSLKRYRIFKFAGFVFLFLSFHDFIAEFRCFSLLLLNLTLAHSSRFPSATSDYSVLVRK